MRYDEIDNDKIVKRVVRETESLIEEEEEEERKERKEKRLGNTSQKSRRASKGDLNITFLGLDRKVRF